MEYNRHTMKDYNDRLFGVITEERAEVIMKSKIETIFEAKVMYEFNVAIDGWTYLVIYGKHVNGGFCCVPNWKWGCEMAGPNEVAYNRDKLMECGAKEEIANEIAKAIQFMYKEVSVSVN